MKLKFNPSTVISTSLTQLGSEALGTEMTKKVAGLMANSGNNTVPFGNIGNPFNTAEAEIKPDETVLKGNKSGEISSESLKFPYGSGEQIYPNKKGILVGRRVNISSSLEGVQILETGVIYRDTTNRIGFDDEILMAGNLPASRGVPTVLYIQGSDSPLWSVSAVDKFLSQNPQAKLPTEEQLQNDMIEHPNKYRSTGSVRTDITNYDYFEYTIGADTVGSYLCKDGDQYKVVIFRPSDFIITRLYNVPQDSSDFITVHLLEN